MTVRRLAPDDTHTLRALRLEAIADAPDAFGSTLEREEQRSPDDWQRWFDGGAVWINEQPAGHPVGLVAAVRDADEPAVGAYLAAMWVRPGSRGTGASDALVQAVIDWAAAESMTCLRLYVLDRNAYACRLYERHGFRPTGVELIRERDGAKEVLMQRG